MQSNHLALAKASLCGLFVLATVLVAGPSVNAAGNADLPEIERLHQLVDAELDPELGRTIHVYLSEIQRSPHDGRAVVDAANGILGAFVDSGKPVSEKFIAEFVPRFNKILSGQVVEAGWRVYVDDWQTFSVCNNKLECERDWTTKICVVIVWEGPDGSGGVNCFNFDVI